jgi:hypothetical protein
MSSAWKHLYSQVLRQSLSTGAQEDLLGNIQDDAYPSTPLRVTYGRVPRSQI